MRHVPVAELATFVSEAAHAASHEKAGVCAYILDVGALACALEIATRAAKQQGYSDAQISNAVTGGTKLGRDADLTLLTKSRAH